MVAVSPTVSELSLVTIPMVGAVVSEGTVFTLIVTLLLLSNPSVLKLLAASLNLLLATLTTPLEVLLDVGVNVAV